MGKPIAPPKEIIFSLPHGRFPRLVLAGNSNVGKSSITKLLLSHPQWYKGKVGKTPGSTVRLTIINDPKLNYHVIDLPGFGWMARRSTEQETDVQNQILKYFQLDAKNIFLTIFVISGERILDELEKWYDNNTETIPLSVEYPRFLIRNQIPCLIVINKIDKLNSFKQKEARERLEKVLKDFQIPISGLDAENGLLGILETSVKESIGIKELKSLVINRAKKLDLTKFDPREELRKLPVIGKEPKEHKEPQEIKPSRLIKKDIDSETNGFVVLKKKKINSKEK